MSSQELREALNKVEITGVVKEHKLGILTALWL